MRAANAPGGPPGDVPPRDGSTDHAPPRPPAGPGIGDDEGGADDAAFSAGRLSERDRQILAFERQWWKYAGAKEQAIREKFDMSATRYYQLLNILIDRPEALECDPMLVKRLRRMRTQRQRSRAARRLGIRP
ncbi:MULTISPECIES: DUF3263 domain-containing protein [Actinomadura]|uniref:DUF3263 domain-containing protein n=1 Tax=Actinomadura madurae TaxID=1993 RepID=A0A1I5YLQ2_9ACTN|nr:Protein of unknown function [Actinomadura madurae]SPT64532.1 Protein of uncharacterised function (DUF3263) [Actinomadura madurae]